MNIKGKTIIITGAARVGKSVVRALGGRGANLVLTYHRLPQEVEIKCEECDRAGSRVAYVQTDVSREDDIRRLAEEARKQFGRIDGLVHMAAIYKKTPWASLGEKDWNLNMDVIAKSTYLLGKIIGDELLKNAGDEVISGGKSVGKIKGKIITIADWSVIARPYKDYLPYNAAKGTVIALTKSLAKELAPHILVNSIAPGPILQPPDLTEDENREVLSATPVGHWGGAEEIAKAVAYFFDADFVTGQILAVDGGRTIG